MLKKEDRHSSFQINTIRFQAIKPLSQRHESCNRRCKSTTTNSNHTSALVVKRTLAGANKARATIDSARVQVPNDRRASNRLNCYLTQAGFCISLEWLGKLSKQRNLKRLRRKNGKWTCTSLQSRAFRQSRRSRSNSWRKMTEGIALKKSRYRSLITWCRSPRAVISPIASTLKRDDRTSSKGWLLWGWKRCVIHSSDKRLISRRGRISSAQGLTSSLKSKRWKTVREIRLTTTMWTEEFRAIFTLSRSGIPRSRLILSSCLPRIKALSTTPT